MRFENLTCEHISAFSATVTILLFTRYLAQVLRHLVIFHLKEAKLQQFLL